MQRQGADRPQAPDRTRPTPRDEITKKRVGPRQYLREVRAELKKVAWPTRKEVINSTIVVLIAVGVSDASRPLDEADDD